MAVRLQFEGIRCFAEPQDAVVRPLTLLVGENSSGKSTFLALCRIASAIVEGLDTPFSFNEPPFLLGAYDQIASYQRGRAGHAKSFSITARVSSVAHSGLIRAEFVSRNGQPALNRWGLIAGGLSVQIVSDNSPEQVMLVVESARGKKEVAETRPWVIWDLINRPLGSLTGLPEYAFLGTLFSELDLESLRKAADSIRKEFGPLTYALAPIRTSPRRTYDPVFAEAEPEGSHVPMALAVLSDSEWANLRPELKEFGSKSGLFEQIEVIRKGKKESDPFQIGVKSGGSTFNLVDVGYGVSQALPILVDTLQRHEAFLIQQPEVHLHPRAQAEMGSFFARQAGKNRRFVIETHSDHLVDRVRMEVRAGTLRCDDVSLLYFERQKHGATIHNLELDQEGNITNPPTGYRQFFLNEERDLLGV